MKTLGILGGIAPESTIAYYRAIIEVHRRRTGQYPSVLINSIDLTKMLGLVADGRRQELVAYLVGELQKLVAAGAEIGLMASNTPHLVFDELAAQSPIPLLSIVEATREVAARRKLRRLALFGTRFTMEANFYGAAFRGAGMEVVLPVLDDRELIHERYMTELVPGRFLPETRDALLAVVDRLHRAESIDGVILGGTELPLLLRDESWHGVALLDTGRIHVERAVEEMLSAVC